MTIKIGRTQKIGENEYQAIVNIAYKDDEFAKVSEKKIIKELSSRVQEAYEKKYL